MATTNYDTLIIIITLVILIGISLFFLLKIFSIRENKINDITHANSINYNADLDQIIINCASWNEFWIIDHSTTTVEAADSVGGYSGKGGRY